jgi:hypothetical protein
MILQVVSFVAAMVILVAYVGHQTRRMDPNGVAYNVMNAVGSGVLTYVAFHPYQIGFIVLEGVWAIVSTYAIVRAVRNRNANLSSPH